MRSCSLELSYAVLFFELYEFHLNMVILLFVKKHFCLLSNVSSTLLADFSVRFGEIVVITLILERP